MSAEQDAAEMLESLDAAIGALGRVAEIEARHAPRLYPAAGLLAGTRTLREALSGFSDQKEPR